MHDLSEEFAHPKINVLHLPQHFSQFEARNTDDDNAKQQKRKIEDKEQLFAASHMCTGFAPHVQTGGEKANSPLGPEEPLLSSIKQTPFFHCTFARLTAAHTFLMTEISRHALTDLSSSRTAPGPTTVYSFKNVILQIFGALRFRKRDITARSVSFKLRCTWTLSWTLKRIFF